MSCISNCQAKREISCPNCWAARYFLTPGELPDCSHLEKASFSLEVTFLSSSCGGGFSIVYVSVGLHICETVACCGKLPVAHSLPTVSVLILLKTHFLIDPQFSTKNRFPRSQLPPHIRRFGNGLNYFVLLPGSSYTSCCRGASPMNGKGESLSDWKEGVWQ